LASQLMSLATFLRTWRAAWTSLPATIPCGSLNSGLKEAVEWSIGSQRSENFWRLLRLRSAGERDPR
jgi:hypothetical protein